MLIQNKLLNKILIKYTANNSGEYIENYSANNKVNSKL